MFISGACFVTTPAYFGMTTATSIFGSCEKKIQTTCRASKQIPSRTDLCWVVSMSKTVHQGFENPRSTILHRHHPSATDQRAIHHQLTSLQRFWKKLNQPLVCCHHSQASASTSRVSSDCDRCSWREKKNWKAVIPVNRPATTQYFLYRNEKKLCRKKLCDTCVWTGLAENKTDHTIKRMSTLSFGGRLIRYYEYIDI